jgi:WhiB family redox-sensing transcriptional regulator
MRSGLIESSGEVVDSSTFFSGNGKAPTGVTEYRTDGDVIMWVENWAPSAACRQASPDQLFVRGAEQNKAKQLCTGCTVRTECLAEALDNQIEWGVWGGMTERERRALLRRRPNVTSWRRLLETAMLDHVAAVSASSPELVPA